LSSTEALAPVEVQEETLISVHQEQIDAQDLGFEGFSIKGVRSSIGIIIRVLLLGLHTFSLYQIR
jgi:hypothetical protein